MTLMVSSWDDWVPQDRLRKFTEENKELAQDLKREMDDSRARAAPKSTASKKKTAGSDLSSARGSEERHSSLPVTGRGSKRGRDNEIEKVGEYYFIASPSPPCPDLDSDMNSDFGWSGVSNHANTPDLELEPVFACYDGTGDAPPRRSERKPKPKAIFEQKAATPPRKRKKPSPSDTVVAPAEEANTSSTTAPVTEEATETLRDTPLNQIQATHAAEILAVPTGVAAALPNMASVTKEIPKESPDAASHVINDLDLKPVAIAQEQSATVNMEAPEGSRKPASHEIKDVDPKPVAVPEEQSASVSIQASDVPIIALGEVAGAPDLPLVEGNGALGSASTDAVPPNVSNDSSSLSTLTPPPRSTDEVTPPAAKRKAKTGGRKPPAKGKGKAAKGKAKPLPPPVITVCSPDVAPEDAMPMETLAFDPPPDSPSSKPKKFRPAKKDPPLPTDRQHEAAERAKLGVPAEIPSHYAPEFHRYQHDRGYNYFYAGIPPDMPRKPRNRMGPPQVSKERARWMNFRNEQRRKGLSRIEINEKWETILADEAKAAALHDNEESDPATTNQDSQNSSTSQSTDVNGIASTHATIQPLTARCPAADAGEGCSSGGDQVSSTPVNGKDSSEGSSGEGAQAPSISLSIKDGGVATTNGNGQETSTTHSSQGSTSTDTTKPQSPSSSSSSTKKRKAATPPPDNQPTTSQEPQEPMAKTIQTLMPPPPARGESSPKRARKSVRKNQNTHIDHHASTQEETFTTRPAVRLPISDHLKALLVDDWESVTKNLSLVPLPSAHPVTEILSHYLAEEKTKRRVGSSEMDLLEEVVAGVREYFNQCLGRILLYRFEREQFFEVRKTWEEDGKAAADVYGAEHLARLFGMSLFPTCTFNSLSPLFCSLPAFTLLLLPPKNKGSRTDIAGQ